MSNLPTILIPYFRLRYLDEALASLAAQDVRGFKVFVGDDASPEDPREVLAKYESKLDIRYHRFGQNLGSRSLAQHWNRCVRMTDAEWLWLFSDDDVAAPDCIEAFLETREATRGGFDVYRFNTDMIDAQGAVIHRHPRHPTVENGAEFALAKLSPGRFSFAVEHVFRRSAFEASGGFVDFPLAWFSDDASWVAFAGEKGLRAMEKGHVRWRKSGINISSPDSRHLKQKLEAFRCYLLWLRKRFPDRGFQKRLNTAVIATFPNQLQHWGGRPPVAEGLKFWMFFARFTGRPNLLLLREFLGLTGIRAQLRMRSKPAVCHL